MKHEKLIIISTLSSLVLALSPCRYENNCYQCGGSLPSFALEMG